MLQLAQDDEHVVDVLAVEPPDHGAAARTSSTRPSLARYLIASRKGRAGDAELLAELALVQP